MKIKEKVPFGLAIAIAFGLGCIAGISFMIHKTSEAIESQTAQKQVMQKEILGN